MKMKYFREITIAEYKITEHQRYLWDLAKGHDTAVNYHHSKRSHWYAFSQGKMIDYASLQTSPKDGKPVGSLTAYFKHHQPYEGLVEIKDAPFGGWCIYAFRSWYFHNGYVRHIRMSK